MATLRDELIRTGDTLVTNSGTYLYVHPTHRIVNRIGPDLSGWIVAVREVRDPTFRDFVVKLDGGQEMFAGDYEFDIAGVDMTVRQRVKVPGNEWHEMTAVIFALEDDKKLPREVRFHTGYPLDLAEAYEKFSGLPVTFCNAPNMLEVQL